MLSKGDRGSILAGSDRSRTMTVEATVDGRAGAIGIKIDVVGVPFYPADMRPLAKFLAGLASPNVMAIRATDGSEIGKAALKMEEPLGQPGFPDLIEDLALIQWASGMTRKVGPALSLEDAREVRIASLLLRGEPVSLTWATLTMRVADNASEAIRRRLLSEDFNFKLRTPKPHVATIDRVSYRVGREWRSNSRPRRSGLGTASGEKPASCLRAPRSAWFPTSRTRRSAG